MSRSKLECVRVCWSVLQCVRCISSSPAYVTHGMMLQCECCSKLECVAVCCSVLQRLDCISSSLVYVRHDVAV